MITKPSVPTLDTISHVHIIGVGGTLMGAFAAFLKRAGKRVTGSDQNVYPPMSDVLRDAGVELQNGYSPENLRINGTVPDLVVIGNVIRADNPEARAAIDGGLTYSSLPEAMETLLLQKTRNLVVAGTHGKTTTSSILAHTLVRCGKEPSYFIGGVSHDLPFSFSVASGGLEQGRPFVLEGDEYDTAFWDKVPKFNHYLPDDVILTSIEFDHADIYPDFAAVVKAFQGLVNRIRPGGRLIACYDYPSVKELAQRLPPQVEVISYASTSEKGARFWPGNVQDLDGRISFDVIECGRSTVRLSIGIPGMHNVLNALAVWIQCQKLGIQPDQVSTALGVFQGVKRRQEFRGEKRGVLVIDDFAHHPTAVRETLRALRRRYPERRLVTVFEPRSATSRRKVFQNDYHQAFLEADATFIAVPYDQSLIAANDQFSSEQLVQDLRNAGKKADVLPLNVDQGAKFVASFSQAGDLVAVLSNGGFGGFIPKLLQALGPA